MSKNLKKKNFYEILDVKKNCSYCEIKNSFIKLSKKYHPDRNDNTKESHEKFVILNEAYMTLINPSKRQEYDQFLNEKNPVHFYEIFKCGSDNYSRNKYGNNFGKEFNNMKAVFPKTFVITAFLLFFFIGGGIQWHMMSTSLRIKREILDSRSKVASLMLASSRRQANLRGNEEQMKLFAKGSSLNKFSMDDLVEEYKRNKTSSESE